VREAKKNEAKIERERAAEKVSSLCHKYKYFYNPGGAEERAARERERERATFNNRNTQSNNQKLFSALPLLFLPFGLLQQIIKYQHTIQQRATRAAASTGELSETLFAVCSRTEEWKERKSKRNAILWREGARKTFHSALPSSTVPLHNE
jgi:hypothetical protein